MSTDTTQYLSTTEFANRYNAMMPIDKDHMPLEPSFVELLCQKGEIEHSIIPARDGRKRDTLMIPEYELEKLDILLNKDKAEKVEPKVDPIIEKPLLTTKEVAELLGCHVTNVALMVTNGKLKPARNDMRGSRNSYKFDEDYILKYMEEHPKREHKQKEKPVADATTEVLPKRQFRRVENPELMEEIKQLKDKVLVLSRENQDLKEHNGKLADTNFLLRKQIKDNGGHSEVELFEAYRKGFKDGYEMGGKQ